MEVPFWNLGMPSSHRLLLSALCYHLLCETGFKSQSCSGSRADPATLAAWHRHASCSKGSEWSYCSHSKLHNIGISLRSPPKILPLLLPFISSSKFLYSSWETDLNNAKNATRPRSAHERERRILTSLIELLIVLILFIIVLLDDAGVWVRQERAKRGLCVAGGEKVAEPHPLDHGSGNQSTKLGKAFSHLSDLTACVAALICKRVCFDGRILLFFCPARHAAFISISCIEWTWHFIHTNAEADWCLAPSLQKSQPLAAFLQG